MSIIKKIKDKKQKLLNQMQRGRVVTQQMKAEKIRKKINKKIDMKPGARKAIYEGLAMRKYPLSVMKDEYSRRQYERKQKQKGKEKT